MLSKDEIVSNVEFNTERVIITKHLIDDHSYDAFYKDVYIKSSRERITVFVQSRSPLMNYTFENSMLAASLQQALYLKAELAIAELKERVPFDTDLFLGFTSLKIKIRGASVPMLGFIMKREADVYSSITSIALFNRLFMQDLEKHYLLADQG